MFRQLLEGSGRWLNLNMHSTCKCLPVGTELLRELCRCKGGISTNSPNYFLFPCHKFVNTEMITDS